MRIGPRTRRIAFVGLILMVICIFLGVSTVLLSRSSYVLNEARVILAKRLERELRHPVTIRSIKGNLLTGIQLGQLQIADTETDLPHLVTVESIQVRYRLLALLRGRFLISKLIVDKPQVNAGIDKNGQINLAKLMPPPQAQKGQSRIRLLVKDLRLSEGHFSLLDPERGLELFLGGIRCELDGPETHWEHTGTVSVTDTRIALNDSNTMLNEFSTRFELHEQEGKLNELRVALGDSLLSVSGSLGLDASTGNPSFLQTNARLHLDLSDLQHLLPPEWQIEGVTEGVAEASGHLPRITGMLGLELPAASVNRLTFDNLVTRVEFTQDEMRLVSLSGDIASGKLHAEGSVKLGDQGLKYHADLQLTDLQLAELVSLAAVNSPLETQGRLSVHADVSGSQESPTDIEVTAEASLVGASVNGVGLRGSSIDVVIREDVLQLSADLDEAHMEAHGKVGLSADRDLILDLRGVNLGKIAAMASVADLTGIASLTGTSTEANSIEATFQVEDIALRGIPLGSLASDVAVTADSTFTLAIHYLNANSNARLEVSGSLVDGMPTDIALDIPSLQVADFTTFMAEGKVDATSLTGEIRGVLALQGDLRTYDGSLPKMTGQGHLELGEMILGTLRIDPGRLPLQVQDSTLTIPEAVLSVGGQSSRFHIELSPEGDYQFSAQAESLSLAALVGAADIPPLPLNAELDIKLSGHGNLLRPRFDAELTIAKITYEGKQLGQIDVSANLVEGMARCEVTTFGDQLQFSASLNTADDLFYEVQIRADHWDVTPTLHALGVAEPSVACLVDGQIVATGILTDTRQLAAQLTLPILELGFGGQRIRNRQPVQLAFQDERLHLNSVVLGDASSTHDYVSSATGSIYIPLPQQLSDMAQTVQAAAFEKVELASDRFLLETLVGLSGTTSTLSGRLRYRLSIEGPVLDPEVQLVWNASELHVQSESLPQPIAVQRLDGQAEASKQGATLDHLSFDLFGNPVLLQGNVYANLESPMDSLFRLQLSAEGFRLGSLSWISPEIQELDGELDLQADVTGSIGDPVLHAQLGISHGTARVQRFPLPLEKLWATLQLHAHLGNPTELLQIALDEATWEFAGGDYAVSANWQLPRTEAWEVIPATTLPSLAEQLPQLQAYILSNMRYDVHARASGIDLVRIAQASTPIVMPLERAHLDLRLEASGTGSQLEQSQVRLSSDRVRLRLNGQDWHNTRPVRLGLEDGRLRVRLLQLGHNRPWLTVTGALDPQTQEIEASLKLNAVPVTAFVPPTQLAKLGNASDLNGPVTTVLSIAGTLSSPVIEGLWRARGRTSGVTASTRGTLAYEDRQLVFQGSAYLTENNTFELEGHVPIDLSLQPVALASRLLDEPIDIGVRAHDFRMESLSSLHPSVERVEGVLNVDLGVTGTTREPSLAGRISLSDAGLVFSGSGPPLTDLNVDIPIRAEGVDGPRLRFRMGSALVQARTRIDLDGLLPTVLTVERARVSDLQLADRFSRRVAANLKARLVAEANLRVPLGSLIASGPTPWTPQINQGQGLAALRSAKGAFTIQEAVIESNGKRIANPEPISVSLQNGEMRLSQSVLLAEETFPRTPHRPLKVEAGGVLGPEISTDFQLDVRDFDVHFLSALLPANYRVHSLIGASLRVDGTSQQPQAVLDWEAEEFVVNGAPVDRFTGKLLYREGQVSLGEESDPVRLSMGANHAFLVASVARSALATGTTSVSDAPVQGRLDLTFGDLAVLPSLVPVVGQGQGDGEVHVTLGGTAGSPKVWGIIDADKLGFTLPDSYLDFSATQARLQFTEQEFQIQRFDGKLNGSSYQIRGSANWAEGKTVDISLAMPQGFTYHWPGLYEVKFQNLDLSLAGPMVLTPAPGLPPIRGLAQVSSGEYVQDWRTLVAALLDKPSEAQTEVAFDAPIIRDLQLDVDLAVPDSFLVASKVGQVDVEVSVLGKVLGPLKKPIFSGRIGLLRGDFSLLVFRPQFTLSEGSFVENTSTFQFDPTYEVYAQTKSPLRDIALITTDGELRTRDMVVSVSVTGRLSEEPIPQFSAQVLGKAPGETYQLSQSEIISVLVLGRVDPAFSQATASAGQNSLSDFILGQSQTLISQQLAKVLGLQGVELDLDLQDFEQSEFTVSKTLLSRLSVTYTSTFELHGDPRIGIEYQILPNVAIRGERNENGKHGIDLTLEREF